MQTRSIPSICLGPTGNLQGSYYFFSLVTGKVIKRCNWDELPVPQSVINRVAFYAAKSTSPPDLIFADCHCHPYNWPDKIIVGSDNPQSAPYPDLPANIPGVHIACQGNVPQQSLPPSSDEPDWAQMSDDALANADIDDMNILLPLPEVIMIDDDNDVPLPPSIKQSLEYLPKLEQTDPSSTLQVPTSPPVQRNPSHHHAPLLHLDNYHLFATVADDVHTLYPYVNTKGQMVDLAIKDEHSIAQVCHYVMLHCAESTFICNPNKKNNTVSKLVSKNLLSKAVRL